MSPSERDFKRAVSLASNAVFTLKTGALEQRDYSSESSDLSM